MWAPLHLQTVLLGTYYRLRLVLSTLSLYLGRGTRLIKDAEVRQKETTEQELLHSAGMGGPECPGPWQDWRSSAIVSWSMLHFPLVLDSSQLPVTSPNLQPRWEITAEAM